MTFPFGVTRCFIKLPVKSLSSILLVLAVGSMFIGVDDTNIEIKTLTNRNKLSHSLWVTDLH